MKTDPTLHSLALQFSELHEGNTTAYHHAKDVLTWLFEKPLSDRLTAEERESVNKLHTAASGGDTPFSRGYLAAIIRIFGAAMFEKKGGSK